MKKVAIIGAGISGLFIANLFKKNSDYQISIYEKNESISLDEGYGIQLSVNSVKFLNEIGFNKLEEEKKFNPEKIDFYLNKGEKKICDLNIARFNTENCKYTTLKRSELINFLKKDLENSIITGSSISKIDQLSHQVKLYFKNEETEDFDYLIISDGVFSHSKNLVLKRQIKPKYYDSIAIRGSISSTLDNIDNKNISLFLNSNFHYVIYPVNPNGNLNFVAIAKYKLTSDVKKDYSLLSKDSFKKKILSKVFDNNQKIFKNLSDVKIFPIFVSSDFYQIKNNNIHLIGDAFFAYPPSFAQGASQSIENAYDLYKSIENKTEKFFFAKMVKKAKMINIRSKFNQFTFHLSNPISIFLRNFFLKKLIKNKKFLESYLGKIYRN